MAWSNVFTASRMDRSQGTQPGACCNGARRDPSDEGNGCSRRDKKGGRFESCFGGQINRTWGTGCEEGEEDGALSGDRRQEQGWEQGRVALLGHGEVTSFPHKDAVAELSVRPRTSPLQVNGEKEGFRAFFSLRLQPES